MGIWVCSYNLWRTVSSKNCLDKSSCCQICAFPLKCKNHLYRATTCGLIGQPFILSLQALLNIPVSLFFRPLCLLGCLPFAILSLFSCIQFLISLSLSLCVPLLCPSLWLLFLSPSLYLTLICWYGSGCIIQEDTCSLFITEQKKGGEEWANEGGWNRGREIHTA